MRRLGKSLGLIVAVLLMPVSAVVAQGGAVTHVVAHGETLYRIGARYGVSVESLMQINGLYNPSYIYVGQRLVVPVSGSGYLSVPNVQSPIMQEGARTHIVSAGENLYRIGLRYGVSIQALAWANGLRNPNLIYVGQRLVIPSQQSAPAPQPTQPAASPGPSGSVGKEIVVVLHEQRVYAYENGRLVRSTLASTGVARYPTRVGQFRIYAKYLSTLMAGPGYYLPNVPYTMYYSGGYALHGTYWHNNFGHPMSHGCVNLPTSEARWLYEWAPIGTLVTIRW